MRASRGLHLDYLSRAEYQAARREDVLGVAIFHGSAERTAAPAALNERPQIPTADVATPVLATGSQVYEVWRCGEPAEFGHHQGVVFRHNGDLLFGCIAVGEDGAAASGQDNSPLHAATARAYLEICATLDAENYPHLVRVWNYVPAINRDSHGTERYRQFNTARQDALRASGRALTGKVPAASALGAAHDSPLVVYFLAARTAPTFVENPRQVSAYHYPQEYGMHSPVFSRATLLQQPGRLTLFISGTASIVGHRSLHIGDVAAQTRETLTNIDALLGEANRVAPGAAFRREALACKVYLRRRADLSTVQAQLAGAFTAATRIVYLQADICRQDLLVEIEAAGMCSPAGGR
jgi:chorismate lyase / 3-hydroxybenzoate synthase